MRTLRHASATWINLDDLTARLEETVQRTQVTEILAGQVDTSEPVEEPAPPAVAPAAPTTPKRRTR